jgi:type IV pilus assembly protein PilF
MRKNYFGWVPACAGTTLCLLLIVACAGTPHDPERSAKSNAAAVNTQLGIAYLRQGQLALAKEKLERAEKQNPRDPNVHSALALLNERLGKPAEVDRHYRTAVRLAPQNPDISNNYAVYLCRSGRTEEGMRRFLDAARNPLYRTPEAAYANAGVCLRNAKRFEEAQANFKRALEIRPNFAEAVFQLGELQLDRGNVTDARTQVDRFLSAFEATPDLLLLAVRATHALGDRLAAERYARRLRLEFPESRQTRAIPDLSRNPG